MNNSNFYNEPSRDPRRANLRVETTSTRPVNGDAPEDSPQQPSQASPESATTSMDSNVGMRIRGIANPTDHNDGSRVFDQFANHVASYSKATVRMEQATMKSRQRKAELKKTEGRSSQFPSFLNHCQRAQKAVGEEIATVDKQLQEHEKVRDDLIQAISSEMSSNSLHKEEIEGMRAELEKAKSEMREEISKAREEAVQARHENERMKLEFQRIDRVVSEAHESSAAVQAANSRNEARLKTASQRMNDLSKSVDEVKASSGSLKDEVEIFKSGVQSTHIDLDRRVGSIQSSVDLSQELPASISRIDDTLSHHKSLFDNLTNELDELRKSSNTAASVKADAKNHNTLEAITEDIKNLACQINDLRDYQDGKDEAVANDSDQARKDINVITQEMREIRHDLDQLVTKSNEKFSEQLQLQNSIVSIASREPASHSDPAVSSLKQEVDHQSKLLTSSARAIQSLELRYNNLTTDSIVRDMVREMQVLYPHASATQEAIERLKAELERVSQRNIADTSTLNERISKMMKTLEVMHNEQKVLQSTEAEKQTKTIEDIAEQVKKVAQTTNSNASQIVTLEAAQSATEEERQNMIQTMNHERDRITGKIESMGTEASEKKDRDELQRKIDDINTRLQDVEETTASDVGKLGAQVEALEKAFIDGSDNNPARPSEDRSSQSSGEVPLALTTSRNDSKKGQTPSRPSLLPPSNKPKKRKLLGSSSVTPQPTPNRSSFDQSSDRGVLKAKKHKKKH